MGLPKIKFIIATAGLGLVAANIQKVPGLVITGTAVAGKIAIGQSKQIFSLEQAENSGITETDNPFAYKHVKAFYEYAGTNAELWIMLASDATLMSQMADKTGTIAKKLLNDAGGRIRVLGIVKKSTGTETSGNGLDADVDLAASKLQALGEEFTEKYFPFRGIISGNNFTGDSQALKDYATTDNNRVSIVMANTDGAKEASMGLTLGRLASIPVQRKLHRVKDGAVSDVSAYFTNGQSVETLSAAWDNIADKNYIFMRNFVGRAGFYFSSDPTLTKSTDDFKTLSNGFVMDKALILAYNVLVEELADEVPVTENGNIHPAIIKSWQSNVEKTIDENMTDNGELSAFRCYIDENQNVIQESGMEIELQLLPVGYSEYLTVKIGFTTAINQ
ncbi:MAG TPA: hypothetical protein DCQ50_14740 [Chryseobacterium sp.]|nr:hypothetical protein [Chryseobacterium sp.]